MWVFYFAIARRLHGVRSLGLEPRTFRLRVGCSNQLSYERLAHIVPAMWVFYFALRCHTRKRTSGQGRTDAGRFLRPLPLPLGYRSMAHIAGPMWVFFYKLGLPVPRGSAWSRIRTDTVPGLSRFSLPLEYPSKVGKTTVLSSFTEFVRGSHRSRATSPRGLTTYTQLTASDWL